MLRSWAVPKGLPTDLAHDRLAVPVEDHQLDHATYEDDTKRIGDSGWWSLRAAMIVGPLEGGKAPPLRRTDTGGQALLHPIRVQPS